VFIGYFFGIDLKLIAIIMFLNLAVVEILISNNYDKTYYYVYIIYTKQFKILISLK
jgi:hypothetical protein